MAKTIENVQYSMIIGNEPPSDDTNKVDEPINASISKEPSFNVTQSEIQEVAKYIKRGHETGIMNDTTKSSVVIRHNGQINVSSNRYAQYKLNPSGKVVEEALESVSLSNRRKVQTDDLIINEHKLNPYLYELTDMKKLMTAYNDDMRVGNFCLFGSVLTMSWDMNLKRYVLIRRPARMPMFSPVLNVPEINMGLGITDPLKIDETLLAKSTKGYQVNAVVSDAKSLIGKEGQSRFGTNAGNIISFSDDGAGGTVGTGSAGSPGSSGSPVSLKGNSNAEMIWNFLKSEGFSDEGAAGILGNLEQESNCNPAKAEGIYDRDVYEIPPTGGYGICQWTTQDRVDGLIRMAAQMGKPVYDMSVQLAFMRYEASNPNSSFYCWDEMKKSTSVEDATSLWQTAFERAGQPEMSSRLQYAQDYYNIYHGKS